MATEWQWHYLAEDYTESAMDSGTVRIKLPEREQISVVDIELYATRNRGDYDYCMIDIPEKIEVIGDGSSVLYSCSPETAAFLHFTQIRSIPTMLHATYPGMIEHYRTKICFGRFERDPEYMLDTSLYNNVYLEIPWSLNTTYFTTHTFTYTIRYLRPIQKLSPKGFIRSRDIDYGSHTWGSAGHYYVDLPLKYPWYMIGARIYDLDADMVTDVPHIKLDIDDGRLVLVDEDTDDLIRDNAERLPYPVHTMWEKLCSGGLDQYARSYMGRMHEVSGLVYSETGGIILSLDSKENAQRVKYSTVDNAGVTCPTGVNLSIWGQAYMSCVIIKDWWLDWFEPIPHEPFPVSEHSMAELDFTHIAVTVDDLRVFLQEVCPLKI
ncbi:MAG: hypothetical protein K6T73_08160 [Candidatus Bathyarchaeota archaeon]|nr:hypothetical protein [Candidatus Bathyarchaeota archaeon]